MQFVNSQQVATCVSLMLWIQAEGVLDTPKIKFIGDFFSEYDIHVIAYATCSTAGKTNFLYFILEFQRKRIRPDVEMTKFYFD
jgi:hypothetical protein